MSILAQISYRNSVVNIINNWIDRDVARDIVVRVGNGPS